MSPAPGPPVSPPEGPPEGLPRGLDGALVALAGRASVLVALDFDGTLAPVVADPAAARALPAAARAVEALAAAPGVRVVLVSGRALADLREVAAPPPSALLVASHGAETGGEGAPAPQLDEDARALLSQVVEDLGAVVAGHEGTGLERKPAGAVLHTRQAAPDVAESAAAAALTGPAGRDGVHVLRGKQVVELSVTDADKGSALTALREQLGVEAVLFAGDDTTDEHAFAVLDDDAGDVTVKVGPGESSARWRVAGPEAVAALLQRLVRLRAPSS